MQHDWEEDTTRTALYGRELGTVVRCRACGTFAIRYASTGKVDVSGTFTQPHMLERSGPGGVRLKACPGAPGAKR